MKRKPFSRSILLAASLTLLSAGCATRSDIRSPADEDRLEQAEKRAQLWERVTNPGFYDKTKATE